MEKYDYLEINEELLDKIKNCNIIKEGINEENNFVKDGLLYRGDILCHDGYWKRYPLNQDGVLREGNLWKESPIKILFLMKDYTNNSMDDIRYETGRRNKTVEGQDPIKRDAFTMNIIYWLYGLTHSIDNPNSFFLEIKDGVKCFGFYERYPLVRLNCKKISGGSTCSCKSLQKYLNNPEYSLLLGEQIKLFNANIIVCCGGSNRIANFVIEQCYKTDVWKQFEEDSLWYNEKEELLVIDTYHPSIICSRRKLFEGLIGCFQRFVATHQNYQDKLNAMKYFEQEFMEQMNYQNQYDYKFF